LEQSGGLRDHQQTLMAPQEMGEGFNCSHLVTQLAQEIQTHRDRVSTQINLKQELILTEDFHAFV
jgi:hypothetical protein